MAISVAPSVIGEPALGNGPLTFVWGPDVQHPSWLDPHDAVVVDVAPVLEAGGPDWDISGVDADGVVP